jgi:threonine aldolase
LAGNERLKALTRHFLFSVWQRVDDEHTAVRICTSWGTRSANVDLLISAIENMGD